MHHHTFRQIFIAVGALALFSILVLWSFNTLSDLFGGPQAQYKHALAAIGLLLVANWTLPGLRAGSGRNRVSQRRRRSTMDNAHEQ